MTVGGHLVHTGKKGQATLLIVSVLCVVGVIVLMSSLDVFTKDYNYKSVDFDQVLLDEATSSSFAVMESALSRRLWEPPPDSNCLKADKFSVNGSLPNGITWSVDTTFNFVTKNFEMTATGNYRSLRSMFKKRVKVLDVSDYLLFSGSDKTVALQRLYNEKFPTSLIARDRRIYTRGPLTLGANISREPHNFMTWAGSPSIWPGEYGTIIQGDRVQFGGGIAYQNYDLPTPNPGNENLPALLAPYSHAWGTAQTHNSQFGGGSTVITKSYDVATKLNQQVINASPGPLSKANVKKSVYPIALFSGNPPLEAWKAADSGSYFNDLDRYSIFYYSYAGANQFGIRLDATCISKTGGKLCSSSEDFPKGFKAWRKDADLEGYLYTADAEAIPSPTMNWDNLEALEEDALACGQVVSAPVSAYEDCAVWDANFMKQYASMGSGLACTKNSVLDMENLALNNFNAGDLTDSSKQDRLLRRVIYLKVPTEIKQSNAKGLMVNSLSNDAARKNLALWVVGEDMITLRGFQNDTTSPLDTQPDRLREVVFNMDSTSASGKQAISMVLLSPEQIHLISPFYQPMTDSHFKSYWPASGGKVRPIIHNITDAVRQENDGFKYGYRRYILNNLSLITTSAIDTNSSFFLQGLWSGPDSSADQYVINQCMVSLNGQPLPKHNGDSRTISANIPTYVNDPLSPLPPLGSRYYDQSGGAHFPKIYNPQVFWTQQAALGGSRLESDLIFEGIRIYVDFDATVIPGKRDLNKQKYAATDRFSYDGDFVDLSHKHFEWDPTWYYKPKPAQTPCLMNNVAFLAPYSPSALYDLNGTSPKVNSGRYIFVHTAPDINYRNIGSIVGVDQPVIETRNTK